MIVPPPGSKITILYVCRFAMAGKDMNEGDYDGRTALHLAAAEGHLNVVRYLCERLCVTPDVRDR